MKKALCSTLLAAALLAAPVSYVHADHYGHGTNLFSKENIGRALGTGLGAYLGSKVGKGRGNDAAIAAGAVGGFVLGGKVGRNWNGHHQSHRTHYQNHRSHKRAKARTGYLDPVQTMPDLEYIDSTYRANRTSNVRGGPSMKYRIVEGLQHGEQVRVLGRVTGTDWFMIAQHDIIQGFVHTSLLDSVGDRYSYN